MSDSLMALLGEIHDRITGEDGYTYERELSPGDTVRKCGCAVCKRMNCEG